MLLQTVIEVVSVWQQSVPTAARRSGRFNKYHGTARIARVSQHLYETVRKCLERNNGHLITLQI